MSLDKSSESSDFLGKVRTDKMTTNTFAVAGGKNKNKDKKT